MAEAAGEEYCNRFYCHQCGIQLNRVLDVSALQYCILSFKRIWAAFIVEYGFSIFTDLPPWAISPHLVHCFVMCNITSHSYFYFKIRK